MAAGIVASTLRRKAFHRRLLDGGNRYQTVSLEPGHISISPTDELNQNHFGWTSHGGASRSGSSIGGVRRSASGAVLSDSGGSPTLADSAAGSTMLPRGAHLCRVDFWPRCVNPLETNFRRIEFETFDTLVPKANQWLTDNINTRLFKCETIEKKVSELDELAIDNVLFAPKKKHAVYIKGLRLWYTVTSSRRNQTTVLPAGGNPAAAEIGYMNVIPKCIDQSGKYPVYENLPNTYSSINTYLLANPLEGRILTIETVPMKISKKQWRQHEINPDQTCFYDEYSRHILYITRIYFRYGPPEIELIGAQDFLPDFHPSAQCYGDVRGQYPKYSPLFGAMRKVKEWMQTARNISVTNIQTLQAAYKKRPGTVHTGVNFVDKSEHCPTVRFIRVTYVRPSTVHETSGLPHQQQHHSMTSSAVVIEAGNGSLQAGAGGAASATSSGRYLAPSGFSYKTLLPAPVRIAMCSGRPEYETLTSTLDRSRAWLKLVERRIVSVETFYHPLKRIWHDQDGAETTVIYGEWTTGSRSDRIPKRRRHLVSVVRVYLDGDYREPPSNMLPPAPMVEEINDCRCNIM